MFGQIIEILNQNVYELFKMNLFGEENNHLVSVLVPYPVDRAYSYLSPQALEPGQYVLVPLGNREVIGVVWPGEPDKDIDHKKLKSILHIFSDLPPMPLEHITFLARMARYTLGALGAVLKLSLSVGRAFDPPPPVMGYTKTGDEPPEDITPKRRKVLEAMEVFEAYRPAELARRAGCSTSVLKTMEKQGLVKEVLIDSDAPCSDPNADHNPIQLEPAQQEAAAKIRGKIGQGFSVNVLDGVTGSGKTEVYFEGVTEALSKGKQVLIMLPEIALSNAFLKRFEARYGCPPALWHSHMTPAQRRKTWRAVAKGETKVVIGTRSALFLPYLKLGLIVIDEGHDASYKQEDGVIYHGRDMGILRASIHKIPAVLVSATPSLETLHNIEAGRYEVMSLPTRYGEATMPQLHLIDMKEEREDAQHFLSPSLKEAMTEALNNNQQVLLFLNRRGYAPLTICNACGHRYECDRCTAWLIEHKSRRQLQCHHCGYTIQKPKSCPDCHETESLVACGPGVERIFDEVQEAFPDSKPLILSSDTAEDMKSLQAILKQIQDRKVDIIIGTQIIAKGYHFPAITCVGVVDADLGLSGGDLRASERTWQLLQQVSGRAGRGDDPGHVYIQTYHPENKIMQALLSGDREGFAQIELLEREHAHMPPFSRLVGLVVSGPKEMEVQHFAMELARIAPQTEEVRTLGPAPAPILKIRNKFRYRLLVVANKNIDVQKAVKHWVDQVKLPNKIRLSIDIDPISFF